MLELLHYKDRIKIVDLEGDCGVVTLWSRVDQFTKIYGELLNLGRIACIGNLYGNGLPELLRNLTYNPQIKHIIVLGKDLSGSRRELINFIKYGVVPTKFLGSDTYKIYDTSRIIDNELDHTLLNYINILELGDISDKSNINTIKEYFINNPKLDTNIERVKIELVKSTVAYLPSEPRNHSILTNKPLEAWKLVVYNLVKYGRPIELKKGIRYELQNLKVVIINPSIESNESLNEYGFSLDKFINYQKFILDPHLPIDINYTYGNRIREYFGIDSLKIIIDRLNNDKSNRHCYVSLYDNYNDLERGTSCPCLVSLYFRHYDDKLTLTATFRTHNGGTAWLENVYGLMALLNYVSTKTNLTSGSITIFSHSISLSEDALNIGKNIVKQADETLYQLELDHKGEFMITVDTDNMDIVVQHTYLGQSLGEYRGKSALELSNKLAKLNLISNLGHALYIGRELQKKEYLLKGK